MLFRRPWSSLTGCVFVLRPFSSGGGLHISSVRRIRAKQPLAFDTLNLYQTPFYARLQLIHITVGLERRFMDWKNNLLKEEQPPLSKPVSKSFSFATP